MESSSGDGWAAVLLHCTIAILGRSGGKSSLSRQFFVLCSIAFAALQQNQALTP
jgi:hypothetical protein